MMNTNTSLKDSQCFLMGDSFNYQCVKSYASTLSTPFCMKKRNCPRTLPFESWTYSVCMIFTWWVVERATKLYYFVSEDKKTANFFVEDWSCCSFTHKCILGYLYFSISEFCASGVWVVCVGKGTNYDVSRSHFHKYLIRKFIFLTK